MRTILPAIVVAALAGTCAAAAPSSWNAPGRDWPSGPVRYLLKRAEEQVYRGLRTEEERARFIEAFWARRDPTPETPTNEFLELFAERVAATERLRFLMESTRPMWLTDPGKIYILLGPPISEQRSQMAASERDTVVWTYDAVPGIQERHFSVAFVADPSGELRLSSSPAYDANTVQGLAAHTPADLFVPPSLEASGAPGTAAVGQLRAGAQGDINAQVTAWREFELRTGATFALDPILAGAGAPAAPSELGRIGRLGALQRAAVQRPPEAEVRATPSFEPLPVRLQSDFYRADDGTTYTALSLAAEPGATGQGRRLVPFGGLISLDDERVTYSFHGAEHFASAGPGEPWVFQTGLGLDPGRYRLLFGLEDPATGRVGVHRADLTVPDLRRDPLVLSSVTLARSIRPLEAGSGAGGGKVPFQFGSLEVVPRPGRTLRNGEMLHLYYQVYGARGGEGGLPALDVVYRVEVLHEGRWQSLGAPIRQPGRNAAAQAWSVPLQGWPPGEFRVNVQVVDRNTGYSAQGYASFVVEE